MKSHVCIATPMYDGRASSNYIDSLLNYQKHGSCEVSHRFVTGDSLLSRARNILITQYYYESSHNNFTHLLWQDSDVGLHSNALEKMTALGVDVVAVPIPMKQPLSSQGMVQSITGVYEEVDSMLYKAKYVATGALMLSNNAVDALVDNAIKHNNIFINDASGQTYFNIFECPIINNTYMSEDHYLCHTLAQLGFEIYVDSSIASTHSDSPSSIWTRLPMFLSENILNGIPDVALSQDLVYNRWSTQDHITKITYGPRNSEDRVTDF